MNYNIFNANKKDEYTLTLPFVRVDVKNVKQTEVPTNGEEFLMHVISERRKCQDISICDLDYTHLNRNQSLFVDEVPVAPVPDNLQPTKEWQNIQVADFSEIRSYLSRMRKQNPAKIKKFFVIKDDLQWWTEYFEDHEPTLSCILGFNPHQEDRCLEILTYLIKRIKPGDSVDQKTGRWIYALLAGIRQPPLCDKPICYLRDLARQAAHIRSLIDPRGENALELAAPLNLIICIVGRYYWQYDLADSLI